MATGDDPLDEIPEPDADELAALEELEAFGVVDYEDSADQDERALHDLVGNGVVGRLVEPGADDDGVLVEDAEAEAVARGVDEGDLTAEEAAVHLTFDPPMGDLDDGYLSQEQ